MHEKFWFKFLHILKIDSKLSISRTKLNLRLNLTNYNTSRTDATLRNQELRFQLQLILNKVSVSHRRGRYYFICLKVKKKVTQINERSAWMYCIKIKVMTESEFSVSLITVLSYIILTKNSDIKSDKTSEKEKLFN